MSILNRYYKPWSAPWIIQRFLIVVKEGRLFKVAWKTLFIDYRFTKKVTSRHGRKSRKTKRTPNSKDNFFGLTGQAGEFEFYPLITCENLPPESLSAINRYFGHVYVVNLERRADRRLEMIQKLTLLNIRAEFFPAEDGASPENQAEFEAYFNSPIDPENAHELEIRLKRKVIYSPGAWATLKTYRKLLKDAKKRGFEKILCLQDDAVFAKDFENDFVAMTKAAPPVWKLLYLGASQHTWEDMKDAVLPGKDDTIGYYHAAGTDGAFAIGIDRVVYEFLIREIDRMNCSFDSGPLRTVAGAFKGNCFVVNPNIVIADVKESDIRIPRDQEDFAKTVRWDLSKYDYPFKGDLASIIIPVFNGAASIEKSIRSLLQQTYREIEIIVVDDCSTDDTAEIVLKLSREDDRVRLIRHDANKGCYPARNTGIRSSKGKYIAFQDADDFSLSNRIAAQVLPLALGKAAFTMSWITRSTKPVDEFQLTDFIELPEKIKQDIRDFHKADRMNNGHIKVGYISTMMTRQLMEELGLFWENRFGSDAEYIERILYYKAGISIPENVFVQKQLTDAPVIDGLFTRIDNILMICLVTGNQNLSVEFKQKERLEFQKRFRENFPGNNIYQYPRL